jgi:hypothetical protein
MSKLTPLNQIEKHAIEKGILTIYDWSHISKRRELSEEFIRLYQNKLDWFFISMCQKLSESFIREFKHKVNWGMIAKYQNISEDFLREAKSWYGVHQNKNIVSSLKHVDFELISEFPEIPVKTFQVEPVRIIKNFYKNNDLNLSNQIAEQEKWENLCENYGCLKNGYLQNVNYGKYIPASFIRDYKEYVNWYEISRKQKLLESFIREFKDKVDWRMISRYQKLSEDFIREFQNVVCWYYIFDYQELSDSFIKEFKYKIEV